MLVRLFRNLMYNCNQAASYMPGDTNILNKADLCRAFINSMKFSWQNALKLGGIQNYLQASIEDIEDYFVRTKEDLEGGHVVHNNHGKRNGSDRDSNGRDRNGDPQDNNGHQDNHQHKCCNGNGRRGRQQQQRNNNDESNTTKRRANNSSSMTIDPSIPCPVHKFGKHSWGECDFNVNNPNRRQATGRKENGMATATTR